MVNTCNSCGCMISECECFNSRGQAFFYKGKEREKFIKEFSQYGKVVSL